MPPPSSAGLRRFLALHLPALATDRLRREHPTPAPLATWTRTGNQRLLAAVEDGAAALGLRPGQPVADAQALAPDLLLHPADAAADARALHRLALWARRYTPLAAADPPDGLLLDITGCAALFGGEAALLADALARLGRAGLAARGAVAGAAATSAALARARGDNPLVASGIEAAVAAPLPLDAALRLPPAMLLALGRLGLRRVGDLLAQPRAPLARRFGRTLLDQLDAVTGQRAAPIQPVLPPPELAAALEPLEPLISRAGIDAALDRLLAALAEKLRRAGLGARRVRLLAWRVDGVVQQLAVGTGRPSRDPAHLRRLFAEKLERLEPDLGFERMALEAYAVEPLALGRQVGLGLGAVRDGAPDLAQLLDRLGQRVRVQRVAPRASHWPEHQVAALDAHEAVPAAPLGWPGPGQPVLLLRRPAALAVMAKVNPDVEGEAPPALLRWRGQPQRVQRAEGPRRLAPEWWRDPGLAARDYHRVELASGVRLWLFRDPAGWRLHGYLP
jgi:protein ImuB